MRKALYILGDLDDHDLIWLSSNGRLRQAGAGEVIIRAGEPLRELFFVTQGELAVLSPGGETVAKLGVGDVIGEMSFVEKSSPSVSVAALGPTRLLAIPREALLAEFAANQGFAARFYRALAVFLSDRLRSTTGAVTGEELDNELDEGLLDNLHIAGDRMLRLIDLLEGRTRA
ncbi:cyclic nucleotide-binding domain-containing protein [Rhodobacteraceae bacterium NNCM2]|nr:cyclic nucleotide-binding domain-containing protein [Coraliihabitans acroporae]